MKVIVVAPGLRFLSGIAYFSHFLAEGLALHNDVAILPVDPLAPEFMFPGDLKQREYVGSALHHVRVDTLPPVSYRSPWTWIRARAVLREEQADVVVFQWWSSVVAHVYASVWDANGRALPVLDIHEMLDPREAQLPLLRAYAGLIVRRFELHDAIGIVHSEQVKQRFSAEFRFPADRLSSVPHGLYDHVPRFPYDIARRRLLLEGRSIVLFAGLVRRHKGLSTLLDAFEAYSSDTTLSSVLLIAGEPWDWDPTLEKHLVRLESVGLARRWLRYLTDEELGLVFSAADVLVLPYLNDSVSGIAQVAMAHGLPIIASDLPGLRESIRGYPGATFVPPGDPVALREALRVQLSERKRDYVALAPSWESVARAYTEIFDNSLRLRV